jgi:hypothetical protein
MRQVIRISKILKLLRVCLIFVDPLGIEGDWFETACFKRITELSMIEEISDPTR